MKMSRSEFIAYLEETLIPDLRASGSEATADDFEAAGRFISDPTLDEVYFDTGEEEIATDETRAYGPHQKAPRDF